MLLTPGARLGPYEILDALGAGGMGEVYRARDPRLGRDVAIKILAEAFTTDADRLARFEREARVLASFTHPNIAAIYGLEDQDGQRALVLELVEGRTLADRLRSQGAFALDEALAVVRQIADALDAAHDKGIVHRDLKPANVKLTPDGVVKVLDFGIAKAFDRAPWADASAASTLADTGQGLIVGTAAYMSPEQARGQPVDRRTDIWALGCVLFELLTGRPAFQQATASDTIVKILSADPEWTTLPAGTPPGVVRLLRRCLERDAKRRLRDLGDLDLALDGLAASAPEPARSRTRWAAILATGAIAAAAATVALVRFGAGAADEGSPVRFEIQPPVKMAGSGAFAVSPDGRRLTFIGTGADGVLRLWVRSLDTLETRPVSGTEGEVGFNTSLFWSADSRSIGFYADRKVKSVDALGGVTQVMCEVPGVAVGGSWNRDNVIIVGNTAGGLLRCPGGGAAATPLTTIGSDPSALHLLPSFLPDSRHLLYLRVSRGNPAENGICVADLQLPPEAQSAERVVVTGFGAAYVAARSGPGRILFVKDKGVWAVPFDAERRALAGEPFKLAAPVGTFRDSAFFSAAPGVLIYRGDLPDIQLEWRDRSGKTLAAIGEPGAYAGVSLSPDATRAVVLRENRLNRADQDLWLLDLLRDNMTRFTSDPLLESVPAWSADGAALIFALGHGVGDVWEKPLDGGPGRLLLRAAANADFGVNPLLTFMNVGADGRFLVFSVESATRTQSDIRVLSLDPPVRSAPLIQQDFAQTQGSLSPDGRWIAYTSNESGINEVFARPLTIDAASGLPAAGAATLVSRGGGSAPRWSRDSKELFYQTPAGAVMGVRASPGWTDKPAELFRAPGLLAHWSVAPDGQRFLVGVPVKESAPAPFSVVLNWQAAQAR